MIVRHGLFQDPAPPRERATAGEVVEWLRERIRLTARDLAMLTSFGELLEDKATDELGLLADLFADQIQCSDAITHAAVQAEQQVSAAIMRTLMDQVQRKVFLLGREHAPGHEIMSAASAICEHLGVFVPTPILTRACQAIAFRAATPPRKVFPRRRLRVG
ncbi:MAG TPA: hypothetical protein VJ226_01350 [Bradyrhizobium sp.]|nr:hypothetical protein [Bradyrhizobium sp.]